MNAAVGVNQVVAVGLRALVSPQRLMPDAAIGKRFYEPDEAEEALRRRLEEMRRARGRASGE